MLLLFPFSANAAIRIQLDTSFSNQNWFPLPRGDMRKAAVDSALEEITKVKGIEIIQGQLAKESEGLLNIHVSLIEKAEVAKVLVELHIFNSVSIINTESISLSGKNFKKIYQAIESIGSQAGKRTADDIAQAIKKSGVKREVEKLSVVNRERADIYNQANDFKRKKKYAEARQLFSFLMEDESEDQWAKLASEELRYGLLRFEAESLIAKPLLNAKSKKSDLDNFFGKIEKNYRLIVEKNIDKADRVFEAQQQLDRLDAYKMHSYNFYMNSQKVRLSTLRVYLMEFYQMEGGYPDKEKMQQMINEADPIFEIESFEGNKDQFTMQFKGIDGFKAIVMSGVAEGYRPEITINWIGLGF